MNSAEFNYLIKHLKTDSRAFEALYGFYFDKIVCHISRVYGKTFACDVAQDFFTKLYNMEIKESIKYPTSYVYKICDNIAKDYITENPICEELTENEIEDVLLSLEDRADVYQALLMISDEERNIIYLCIWEGYSLLEISELLHLPYAATRKKYSRSLKKLKALLK
ncbi:MAG: RNA polymerase sigma factor [Clostridia bacterium]